jgi:hypothetical protein
MNKTRKIVFSKKDYNSNDGILTSIWGPSMWHFLHSMSFNYPIDPTCDDKNHYRDFVLNLRFVLPCGKCRKNLCKNFKKLPLKMADMKSRHTFSLYIYKLHEVVNKMLNKKSGLTYNDVRERYEHFRSRCVNPMPIGKGTKLNKCNGGKSKTKKQRYDEKGCTEPLYGEKSKCVLHIVPQTEKCSTFQIDEKCVKKHVGK